MRSVLAVLHNAACNLGVSLGFNIQQLPVFTMEKHRHYGTGICHWLGTWHQLDYNRSYQRALNRVPTIGSKEQRHFDITYTFWPINSPARKELQGGPFLAMRFCA
jgi:hypothetical protein